ncbi:DUF1854 domain-containing protein [Thiobacter aerophilum]|uniref:DUF1854 domain-containing protein n=1 Tax=Thiobacter aerophilum TaxID=3121275 RepID=A0ABV0ECA7_9BURK
MSKEFELSRNAFGRLVLSLPDGSRYEGVVPVRAFPITAPREGVALVAADGHERLWIPALDELDAMRRTLIEEALASREFMPEIRRILKVESFATPSVWQVETDRGPAQLTLKGEEDLRPLGAHGLIVVDSHGIQFLIRDVMALDRTSRRILDRFL